MKNLIQKHSIKLVTVFSVIAVFIASCTKEDDPNIVYTSFNKTIIASVGPVITTKDSIDLNLDSKTDFYLIAGKNVAGDTAVAFLSGQSATNGCYIDSTKIFGASFQNLPLANGVLPEALSTAKRWKSTSIYALKAGATILGFAGAGDQYLPILITNTSTLKIHYGWIRLNSSSDYSTLKIIDGAYNLIPDTPIKMGAK